MSIFKILKGLLINYASLLKYGSIIMTFLGWSVILLARTVHHFEWINLGDSFVVDYLAMIFTFSTLMTLPSLGLGLMSEATNSGWDAFVNTMPVKKSMLVISGYAFYILLSLIPLVILFILPFEIHIVELMGAFISVHVFSSVALTIAYVLFAVAPNSEGGWIMGLAFFLTLVVLNVFVNIRFLTASNAIPIGLSIIVALYAISIPLSVYFDKLSRKIRR